MLTSIIIPTLNEVDNIDPLLTRVFNVIKENDLDAEILVADGGSTDGTTEAVGEWAKTKPVTFIRSDGRRGLSGDVLHAAGEAQGDVVVVMDADLSHPPEALPEMLRPFQDGSADMVIGSRYVKGGKIPGWPWHRRLFSKAATLAAWPLVSVKDPMAGFFGLRRELLLKFGQRADGYKIGLEIMAQSDDTLRVTEVPITFIDRELGTSKLGSRVIMSYLKQIIRLAGGARIMGDTKKLGVAALASAFVDVAVFNLLYALGYGVNVSQLISFAAAVIAVYFLIVRGNRFSTQAVSRDSGHLFPLRFVVIGVLAFLLRVAVMSTMALLAGFPARLAHLAGIGAAAAVLFVGIMFFLFPRADEEEKAGIRWRVLALAAAGYSLILRIFYAGIIDLIPEEAYYWNYGQHLDLGYLDHPPVVGWLNYLSTGLFGNLEIAVRLPAILCWCVTVFFLYRLTKNLFNKTAALITLLMVSVLPIYLGTGMFMMPDPPVYAAWVGALYFLSRALIDGNHRAWIGVGICLGLGMISKYTIILLAPATLIFVLLHIRGRTRRTLLRPELYIGAALSILLFLPVIIWNAENGWASFAFQGARRWSGRSNFSLHILLINILIVITPLGVAAVYRALFSGKGGLKAVLQDIDPEGIKLSFARVYTLFPLTVFALHSLQGLSKFNWTGPVWFAVFPLLGGILSQLSRFEQGGDKIGKSLSPGSWLRNSTGCFLFFGGLLYFIAAGMPGATPVRGMALPLAWDELASEIDLIPMKKNVNGKPLVVGMEDYWITSEYSFYRSASRIKEPAGRHLIDKNSLMWSFWLDKTDAAGRDAILISLKRSGLEDDRLESYFEKLGEAVELPVMKNGRTAGLVYYRKGFSYRPSP
ncbi:MAG: glycosyltransferase family 39 protein [bacterium]|nr:glycosyltransferase family 39 protein [bacterium]